MKTKKLFDWRLWLGFFAVSMLSNLIFLVCVGILAQWSVVDQARTNDLLLWLIAVILGSSLVLSIILTVAGLYFGKPIDEDKCENCTNNCVENN